MDVINQQRILDEIAIERVRQFDKWGDQIHTATHWMSILGEEVGEAEKEAVEYEAGPDEIFLDRMRKELLHAAAVTVAMIEWIDSGAPYPKWWDVEMLKERIASALRPKIKQLVPAAWQVEAYIKIALDEVDAHFADKTRGKE